MVNLILVICQIYKSRGNFYNEKNKNDIFNDDKIWGY